MIDWGKASRERYPERGHVGYFEGSPSENWPTVRSHMIWVIKNERLRFIPKWLLRWLAVEVAVSGTGF